MLKSNLTEITKNKVGTGLLLENDGYISMSEGENKKLFESVKKINEGLNEGEFYCPYPFVVHAVFQKFGIENANGRIYPEDVLKKQVAIYQQKINEKRAYGECYRPDALILTKTGWKALREVKEGEEILTLNPQTNCIEIKPIQKIVSYHYNGEMMRISGRNINDFVTPNHGYPVYSRNGEFKGFYTAQELKNRTVPDMNHSYIPKQGEWEGLNDEFFVIKGVEEYIAKYKKNLSKKLKEKYSQDLIIPMEYFAKFMGIYLSEGHFTNIGNNVTITQKKPEICEEIERMLSEWGIQYRISERKSGTKDFIITDMRLHKYVSQFGKCYDKYVPYELKQQNKKILQVFYDWFLMGDGRIRGDKRIRNAKLSNDVFSTSKQLVLDLNEIQLKIGKSGNYHVELRDCDRYIEGRLIEGKNTHPLHFSYLSQIKGIYLDERFLTIEEENYDGDVMCVEVENHIWYVMDNGKCHWTKNCNHPESRTSVNLDLVAMNILELHWEGQTLVGQLEVITTPGFRKYGIASSTGDLTANLLLQGLKIGVSSRGVGSVEHKFGKYIVGDDYEIICWDYVSDPSTRNAWVDIEKEKLTPYLENTENKKPILSENTKLDKFSKWLND